MSSIEGEDHAPGKQDTVDIPSDKEPPVVSRIAYDSEHSDTVTKELSPDHACTAEESCSEREVSENKTPVHDHESLPDVVRSSQEVDKSIKSPPIDTSQTSDSSKEEKGLTQDEPKEDDSSATAEENDEWLDILGTGHLKKKIIQEGEPNSRPTPSCQVTIRTKGTLEDSGKPVDINDSITFAAGEGDIVQAWDLVVSLMCKGEICLVKTTARFAYGEFGREPDVPPNAGILYELELLEVNEPIDIAMLPEEEMLKLVDGKCNRGNWLFQRREYLQAVSSYQKGGNFLQQFMERYEEQEDDYVMSDAMRNMKIRCLNNLAATQLKTKAYKECLESCEKVLALDKDNVKALFRYGKVMLQKGESSSAVQYLRRAQELNPNEKVIKVELQEAIKLHEVQRKKEKDMYKKMVQGLQNDEPKVEEKHLTQSGRWGAYTYAFAAAMVAVIGIGFFYYFQNHKQ